MKRSCERPGTVKSRNDEHLETNIGKCSRSYSKNKCLKLAVIKCSFVKSEIYLHIKIPLELNSNPLSIQTRAL
jgi:hypothetical protein